MEERGLKYRVRYKANGQLPHACSPHDTKADGVWKPRLYIFAYFPTSLHRSISYNKAKHVLR